MTVATLEAFIKRVVAEGGAVSELRYSFLPCIDSTNGRMRTMISYGRGALYVDDGFKKFIASHSFLRQEYRISIRKRASLVGRRYLFLQEVG